MKTYRCTFCGQSFLRYPSTVRNQEKVFCSVLCRYQEQKTSLCGTDNPNYKDGLHIKNNRLCKCGNTLDYRARKCQQCRIFSLSKEELQIIVQDSQHLSEVATKAKCSRSVITNKIKKWNIDISHFILGRNRNIPDNQLFVNGIHRRSTVKKRLIEKQLVEYKCKICGLLPEWNNIPLVLELDHINGNYADNRIENLRLLCPNCHSQQPTSKGKNYGSKRGK